ncbi:ATP-binding protein [Streptomyces sp. NPDC012888]|uniref:ATP-binding protein n=1 Tax=Streptomyces sp. NPDC012888 TaxID=3364855 RepID=UPI0036BB5F29
MPPLTQHTDLPDTSATACARRRARDFFDTALHAGRPLADTTADAALLLISELVSNAVRHTHGPCSLDLALTDTGVDIDVTDSSPVPPRPRPADTSGEGGGFGWNIVNTLAGEVSVRPAAEGGKTVHVHMPLPRA